jgi:hypothetical protein
MSRIAAGEHLVKSINSRYSRKILEFNKFEITESVGLFFKVNGFDNYNQLLNINSMFSERPAYEPVDRTGLAQGPIRYCQPRAWQIPTTELTLEEALEHRVQELCNSNNKINLFWSGGIDSTTILVAFIKYAPNLKQFRVIHSPWSVYEHPDFYKLLQTINDIELVDISGDYYLNFDLDGIFISGSPGDELHASLDQSFFESFGYDFLFTPWKDFFYNKLPDSNFIDFCEKHFSAAGRPINTILEARWWFYASSKLTSILNTNDLGFFSSTHNSFDPSRLVGFFDCDAYEQFIYFNIDKIICSDNYASWRQFLKDFCFQFDSFEHWKINKSKFGSGQLEIYTKKKQILNDSRNLMILSNGERVTTPNLPLFSQLEWDCIKEKYQYVFRQPNSI